MNGLLNHLPPPPPPPLPLLITGLAGVAGFNAHHYFHSRYPGQVIGIRQERNWPLQGPGIVACDTEDSPGLQRLFERYQFRSVLNCAGNCALKSCELDPRMAWRINVVSIRNLLEAMHISSARLVHLSIDLVYSGRGAGKYREHHTSDPVTVYGSTMVAGEQMVLLGRPEAAVLRISLPMGVSYSGHAGAIDWIQSRFRQHKPATLYFDEVRTPTYTDCLNRLFQVMLANQLAGLYHAGGPRALSLFQIAQIVNRVGGYDPRHLLGCLRHEAGPLPPRAGDVSMDSSKLAWAIGFPPFDPWPLTDDWVPTHPEWHWERHQGPRGSHELLAEILYRNPRHTIK